MHPIKEKLKSLKSKFKPFIVSANVDPSPERELSVAFSVCIQGAEKLLEPENLKLLETRSESSETYRAASAILMDVFALLHSIIPAAATAVRRSADAPVDRKATMTRSQILALKPTDQSSFFAKGGRIVP